MPTLLRIGPCQFFFYAGDGAAPPHVHVGRDNGEAKFLLDPIRLERSYRFGRKEVNRIRAIVEQHQVDLLESWHEFFRG